MPNAYLISGNEPFEIKRAAQVLVDKILQENPDYELDLVSGDIEDFVTKNQNREGGKDAPREPTRVASAIVQNLMNSLQTDSLFSAHKVVWLKHCSFFDKVGEELGGGDGKKGKGKGAKQDVFSPLSQFIEEKLLPDTQILVIDGVGLDRRKSFYKLCESAGFEIQWFAKPDPTDKDYAVRIRTRIQSELDAVGLKALPDAKECLSLILGSDAERIRLEIEKLSLYLGDEKTVTREDCLAVCSRTPEALAWALTDALKLRDLNRSFRALDDLIAQIEAERGASSSPENSLLAGIVNTFQSLAKARAAFEALGLNIRRVSYAQIKALDKTDYPGNFIFSMHPYVAFKTAETLRLFSDAELVKILHEILEVNKDLVSSGSDNKRASLERLIYLICQPSDASNDND